MWNLRTFLHGLVLSALAGFTVGPFLWLLSTALKGRSENIFQYPPALLPARPTLGNFIEVSSAVPLAQYAVNSIAVTLSSMGISLVVSSLAAYPLARMSFRGRGLVEGLLAMTLLVPAPVLLIPLFLIVSQLQLMDTLPGVVLPFAVNAFGILLMRNAFLAVPAELEEAARLDGANAFTIFWRVALPLVTPSLATLALFDFVAVWGDFLWPLLVLKDPAHFTLSIGVANLAGTFSADWRLIAAGSVLTILPILAVFAWLQRYFVGDQAAGAVKG